MTFFDLLGGLLDRLHKRSPAASYVVAVLIAASCALAITYLNADGSPAGELAQVPHSTVGAKT